MSKTQAQEATEAIYTLAVRTVGIRQRDEYTIYKQYYGSIPCEETGYTKVSITPSQKSYIRRKVRELAKENNQTAIFVPDWVGENSPRSSWNDLLTITNEMYERMQEYVNAFMMDHSLPPSSRFAVEQQLFVLLVPGYSKRGIFDTTELITQTIDLLEKNKLVVAKKPAPLPEHTSVVFEGMKDIEEFIY